MRVLVYGAGGVGLGLGSFLLAAGEEACFLARGETAEALLRRGLRRSGCLGEHRAAPEALGCVTRLDALADDAPDFVLVAVKSFDSAAAARDLAHAGEGLGAAPIVLCQNGWGNAEHFRAHFPEARIWNARVITGFRRKAPAEVEVTVHAEPLRIGSLFGQPAETVASLCAALARGGIPAEPSPDIAADLWAKLLYNACLNPPGALLGLPYGALGASPPGRALLRSIVEETFAVMRAAGYHSHWPDAGAYLEDFHARLLPATARHESSTLQDLRAGRPTEIDALTGAVVRLGEAHGVATPVSRTLLDMVKILEARDGPSIREEDRPAGRGARG